MNLAKRLGRTAAQSIDPPIPLLLIAGIERRWGTRHERRSPRYTTRLDEVMRAGMVSGIEASLALRPPS